MAEQEIEIRRRAIWKPGTHPASIDDAGESIRARAGLHNVRIHGIRHSCASNSTKRPLSLIFFVFYPNPSSYSHRIGCNS